MAPMAYNKGMRTKKIIALTLSGLLISLLAACDWVDSTGRSSNSAPVTQISFADGQQTEVSEIDELKSITLSVRATDADGVVNRFEWNDNPVNQGKLAECEALPNFNRELAVDSLDAACAEDANCRVNIEKLVTEGDEVDFLVSAPKLKANVGVTFELSAVDNEGGTGRQQSTFCLIAINEAPDAGDDSFTVLEGETLVVTADQVNLLTNDSDDEHIGNSDTLEVLIEPKTEPSLARSLTLSANGGFTYESSPLPDRGGELAIDTFDYWVTDGSQRADATVTIRILAKNDPPELLAAIPLQEVVAGVPFESDISTYFDDAEGTNLNFSLASGALPRSGGLTLEPTGLLSGTAEQLDVGSYPIEIIASDGSETVTADVTITVADNLPVEAFSILEQSVDLGELLTLDVSDSFDDPENQPLEYSVDTAYANAELDMDEETGVFEARFEEVGRYTIDVSANDGVTRASSIRFVVTVTTDNEEPIFTGRIANQIIELGDPITPIAGSFSDPNSDVLAYSTVGDLPPGVTINANGVLSGRPTVAGTYAGLRIIATDPLGEFVRSNAFRIIVESPVAPPANTAPEFEDSDSVFNQGITLGQPITPVSPEFSDDDDDPLSYRVIGGTLPDGVTINSATGLISGRPTARGFYNGLIVLATDPSGASAQSDAFWIVVR